MSNINEPELTVEKLIAGICGSDVIDTSPEALARLAKSLRQDPPQPAAAPAPAAKPRRAHNFTVIKGGKAPNP